MAETNKLTCPNCHSSDLVIRLEASYVYSYALDSDAPGRKNTDEFLSFMYDDRDQKEIKQYVECISCGRQFTCYFNTWDKNNSLKELQNTINKASLEQQV